MKFPKSILGIIMLLLILPTAFASDINGWGGDAFFGYDQQNNFFDSEINVSNTIYNDSINFGSSNKPLVCNVDKTNTENELLIYSGANLKMYSGKYNEMQEVATYTATSTIISIGCLGEHIYIGSNDRLEILNFNEESLTWDVEAYLDPVIDISCSYTLDKCLVAYDHGFDVFNGEGDFVSLKGWSDSSITISGQVSFGEEDESALVSSGTNLKKYDLNSDATTKLIYTNSISLASYHDSIFVDIGNDGNFETCFSFKYSVGDVGKLQCYDNTYTYIGGTGWDYGSDNTDSELISFVDSNGDINLGIGTKTYSGTYTYKALTLNLNTWIRGSDVSSNIDDFGYYDNMFGYFDSDNNFRFIVNSKIYSGFYSGYITTLGLTGSIYPIVADLNGDTHGEIILVGGSETLVLFDSGVDTGGLLPEITFASNTIDGGFYGYYTGSTCIGTTITFEALECIGDMEDCNYYNIDTTEQERLKTDCGLGGTVYYGNYDYNNPSVSCTYSTEGEYEVIIFIQDTNLLNTTNNANVPITVTVEDTVLCNDVSSVLSQPYQIVNTTTEDSESGSATDGTNATTIDTTDTDTDDDDESFGQKVLDNLMLLVGFAIIIGVNVTLAIQKVKHPIVYLIATVLISIICNVLGLFSFLITVFIVISMLVISIFSAIMFKGTGAP